MKKFTADFETCTWLPNETYVWAWAVCEIGNDENIVIDNNIDSFMKYAEESNNSIFYFHNLKFDGEFIIYYLLTHGFKHVEKREDIENNSFTTLISDMGQFYQIVVYFEKKNKKVKKCTFIDSLKIIPFSVDVVAKSFGLEISKLKIDYNEFREVGHILTEEERDYIQNDVKIVAQALNVIFNDNLTKMTQGANALADYKEILSKSKFNHFFPILDKNVDKDLRQSYKGGFTYLNPIYKEKDVENVNILDVNSLYPSVMYEKLLPYGEPVFFEGKYQDDKVYPLYIQMITCSFEIKENKIPTIQIKGNKLYFRENEYLTSSGNEIVALVLTNIDLKLFLEQYSVNDLEYVCGWKFKGIQGLFTEYIDKWMKRKIEATKEKNYGQRTLAKLMLNSLYGKFATGLTATCKNPYVLEDGVVRYKLGEEEEKDGIYLPIRKFYNIICSRKNNSYLTSYNRL